MNTKSAVETATLAAKQGDKVRARSILAEIIKQEPQHEEALLLFAEIAEKKEHAIYCYEQVLKFNPESKAANQGLARLRSVNVSEISRPDPPSSEADEHKQPHAETRNRTLSDAKIELDAEEGKLTKRYGSLRFITYLFYLLAILTLSAGLVGAHNVFQVVIENSRGSVAVYNNIITQIDPNAPLRTALPSEIETFGYGLAVAIAVAGIISAVVLSAIAQLIRLLIDMEHNTRFTAHLLKASVSNIK